MVDIPFPLSSAPGRYPGEGAGRLLNAYAEPLGQEAGSPVVMRRVPGLTTFSHGVGGGNVCRGMIEIEGVVWAVIGNNMVLIQSDGTAGFVGIVNGTKKVFMARNNKKPVPDKVLVTESGAFVFTETTIVAYPDIDLPVPIGVMFQDGYFLFPIGDGRVFASELNDTAINAATFATAESRPDGLLAAVPWNNQALFFGPYSMEFWVDAANPTPAFPYSRSAAKARGLVASSAIAGHQNGFGGAALMWVADHNRVVKLNGYDPEDVSPPDLDRMIELVTDKTTLEAYVYVAGGQARWVLSCADWTWEFNVSTQKWNERDSHLHPRWRGTQTVWAFGKWLIGDAYKDTVWSIEDFAYKEGIDPLRMRIESGPVVGFPNRTRVPRADFDFASGVGIATGTTIPETFPVVEISYSDDGGSVWGNPRFIPLGEQGHFRQRVTYTMAGSTGPRGRRWRLDISDPVYAALTKGVQQAQLRMN